MGRPTGRNRFQKDAEARFPHHADIPVLPGELGRRLTDMHQWCRENVAACEWAEHGHQEHRKDERPAISRPRLMLKPLGGDGGAMLPELEILRSTKVVIDHRGADALTHAARRADELLEHGDVQGYELWIAILADLESARAHLLASNNV